MLSVSTVRRSIEVGAGISGRGWLDLVAERRVIDALTEHDIVAMTHSSAEAGR